MGQDARRLLIYDGDCGFCTTAAHAIAAHWRVSASAVPWQRLSGDELSRLGLTSSDVAKAAWWVDERGGRFGAERAVSHALMAADGWRRVLGRLLDMQPIRTLAAIGYPVVARYRHRLPGGTPACRLE